MEQLDRMTPIHTMTRPGFKKVDGHENPVKIKCYGKDQVECLMECFKESNNNKD